MDNEILNKLKINLKKIQEKKEKQDKKRLETTYKNTEKIYYQIWKQILKYMNKKEEFRLKYKFGDFIQIIEVNENPIKIIVSNKIDHNKLFNALKNDGLSCSYVGSPIYGMIIFINRKELKKILDSHESFEKQKTLK